MVKIYITVHSPLLSLDIFIALPFSFGEFHNLILIRNVFIKLVRKLCSGAPESRLATPIIVCSVTCFYLWL